jgi:hypothetical protein
MNHPGHEAAVAHTRGVVWALGWRGASFDTIDKRIAEDAYRHGRGDQVLVERYGKKYGWIGFYTYAGILEDSGRFPRRDREFSDIDIDPSFPEKPPNDGSSSVTVAWLSPGIASHETWIRAGATSLPLGIVRRETIGGHTGPWLAVHGHVSAEDRVLGRSAWAFLSALVASKGNEARLVASLNAGGRPWGTRDVPSDHYTFAGEIPWHPKFALEALAEDGYREHVRTGTQTVEVEVLAHEYAWESYHSEMNQAGSVRVPSQLFSARFNLRGIAQSFNQVLPDGCPAAITLSGVDGLMGDVVYIREDLLRQYVAGRAIVWFVFGGRELRPFPPSPPQWLVDAQQQQTNSWQQVFTEADVLHSGTPSRSRKATGRQVAKPSTSNKRSRMKAMKQETPKGAKLAKRKP